jgi:hypothetical protein
MAGAAAVKQESDALLYYRIDCWSAYSGGGIRNISTTLEVLDFKYCDGASSDGEGLLILPSPSGVLSTIHFEVPPLSVWALHSCCNKTFSLACAESAGWFGGPRMVGPAAQAGDAGESGWG